MYGANHVPAPMRDDVERENPHPIYEAFMNGPVGRAFSRDEVRQKVIPAYMGLIKQADDQMGRLFAFLEESGRMQDTLIVITSDHGDYLGDHWLGEKDLFHEPSVKVPLIIYDPSPEADVTRGSTCDALVEAIDLAPTFLDVAAGRGAGDAARHILEGRSLMPLLHGEQPEWRDYAVSEYNYSARPMAEKLGVALKDARLFMITDRRWKFIHAIGFRPMLFDMETDPEEFFDLGASTAPEHREIIACMQTRLREWATRDAQRVTLSDADIRTMKGKSIRRGITLGLYDATDAAPELTAKYRGKIPD